MRNAALVGITYIPFGLYNGFVAIAMPFLLTARGMPLDHVLALQFCILLPSFLSFLVTPLVDCGVSRRAWAMICAGLAGASLLSGVLMLDAVAHGTTILFVCVMLFGYLAAQMFSSAMGGMIPNLVAEEQTGSVSAWLNTAYLGGTGIGGWLGSVLVPRMELIPAAVVLGLVVFAPCLLLLIVGAEHRVPRGAGETMRRLLPDVWAVSRTRSAIVGLLIFVTPSATFAAQNSFSGLGRDFHAGDAAVTWITGWGSAILCSTGAMLGGWLVQYKGWNREDWRIDRRMVFVGTGVVAAFASLGMAFGPHTATVFFAGTAAYYILAGINYSAASAVAFDIIGANNPLSATQYAMLMAACNLAIETVLKGDQWGYLHGSAKGLLLTDAGFSLLTGTIMLTVIRLSHSTGREQNDRIPTPVKAI